MIAVVIRGVGAVVIDGDSIDLSDDGHLAIMRDDEVMGLYHANEWSAAWHQSASHAFDQGTMGADVASLGDRE